MAKNPKKWTLQEKLLLYKLVETKGKDWSSYGDVFDVNPEAVRSKYRRTDWEDLFEENGLTEDEVLNLDFDGGKDIEKIVEKKLSKDLGQIDELYEKATSPLTVEELASGQLALEREKLIQEAQERAFKEHIRQMATEDLIIEKITGAIISTPPIRPVNVPTPPIDDMITKPQSAVAVLSDLHLGLAVHGEEVGGFSEYNRDIFKERIHGLVSKIAKITAHHRKSSSIDELNIFALGDNVHGSNDAGQWGFLETEQNVVDQLLDLWREFEIAILSLSKVFKKVNFYGVYGNHGRVAKRGKEKRFVNWDYVLYKILEKSLSNQPNVTFSAPRSPFQVATVQGHKFLLTHGDCARSWGGIPFYGLVRAEAKYRSLFDKSKNIDEMWRLMKEEGLENSTDEERFAFAMQYCRAFDYLVLGHFHQSAELESPSGGRIIMNPSFFGGDDFSINSLLAKSTPAQKFFGVHPEGKSWTYDIELDRD